MNRRAFIAMVGGAAAWPLAGRAQHSGTLVIGWLAIPTAEGYRDQLAAFRDGLREQGFAEGRNVTVEYRWAEHQVQRLAQLAADLVGRGVAVISCGGGTATALAAKAATSTIPIVFAIGADPVRAGLVGSVSRPEGNITGVAGLTDALITKRLEVITELLPGIRVIGVLLNPRNPNSMVRSSDLSAAAQGFGRQIRFVYADAPTELNTALVAAVEQRIEALIVQNDPLFISQDDEIAQLAMRHRLPTIHESRDYAAAGGLMSYGPSITERYRLLGRYTGRVLKGNKPADLPIQQPTKFELVINLKTAKALGLEVPPSLLARADSVIE